MEQDLALAQATPPSGNGKTAETVETVVDTALFTGVAYLGITTGLATKKGTTLSVMGWVIGVMGAAKGLISLSKLYTQVITPAPKAPANGAPAPTTTPVAQGF